MSLDSPIHHRKAGRPLQGHFDLRWQVALQLQELRVFRYDS